MPLGRKPSETMGEQREVSEVIVAKCEIVEVNNNIEYVTAHRNISATEKEKGDEPDSVENPFQPSGSVSVDADLMVRLWKERRLDMWTGEGGEEVVGREESDRDNVSSEPKYSEKEDKFNGVKSVNDNITDHKKEENAIKKETNCCSIM